MPGDERINMKIKNCVSKTEIGRMADFVAQFSPEVETAPFIFEGTDPFEELPSDEKQMPMVTHRATLGNDAIHKIIANDNFFSLASIQYLMSHEWTPKDVTIFALFHELAHLATWTHPRASITNKPEAQSTWSLAYSAWPIKASLPFTGLKNQADFIENCRPLLGLHSFSISQAVESDEVEWASNLSELRADALAVVFCTQHQDSSVRNHPLKTNFPVALNQLHESRIVSEQTIESYRWGRLASFLSELPTLKNHTLNEKVAFAECAAWACANENWPYFFNKTGVSATFFNSVNMQLPPNSQQVATTQTKNILSGLKTAVENYVPQTSAPVVEEKTKNGIWSKVVNLMPKKGRHQ